MKEPIFGGGKRVCGKCRRTVFGSALCGCDAIAKRQTKTKIVERPETALDDFDIPKQKLSNRDEYYKEQWNREKADLYISELENMNKKLEKQNEMMLDILIQYHLEENGKIESEIII